MVAKIKVLAIPRNRRVNDAYSMHNSHKKNNVIAKVNHVPEISQCLLPTPD